MSRGFVADMPAPDEITRGGTASVNYDLATLLAHTQEAA